MRLLFIALIALALCACAGPTKPTVFTYPPAYLAEFPLDKMTEDQLFAEVGPPEGEVQMRGMRGYVYRLGSGYGARSWTYLIRDGVVYDVIFNDQSNFNGRTARKEQGR